MYKISFFSKWTCLILFAFLTLNSCGDDEDIVLGCTDPSATNYNSLATDDDGSCVFQQAVLGCTDASATNYDPLATEDDGSCVFEQTVSGCTDAFALNYDPLATEDNGSCSYTSDINWTENASSLPFGIGAMGYAKVPNGLMIFGGQSESTIIADTYIYSESDRSITQGPNLNIPRSQALCIEMNDNRVLIIGGVNINGQVIKTCEIYDPATNSITVTDSMDVARARHKGVLLPDNRILVTGGTSILDLNDFMGTIGATNASTEIYDPVTNTWSSGPEMSNPRVTHVMSSLPNGNVLISGGLSTNGGFPSILNTCEIFNPSSNTLLATANMNMGRSEHTCTVLQDGSILTTGGGTINGLSIAALADVEIFDPISETWTVQSNMTTTSAGHIGFVLNNGWVVTPTGDSGDLTQITPTLKCGVYNRETDQWSETNDLPIGLSGYAGYITDEQQIVIIGGAIAENELSDKVIIAEFN